MASEITTHEPAQQPGPEAFRALMKTLRKGAGLSQRDAAELCDLSQTTWSRMERGWGQNRNDPVDPTGYIVGQVAAGFKLDRVEMLRLAGYDPDEYPEDTSATIKMPPTKAIDLWNDLNDNQRKAWLIMGRLLKNPNAVVNWSTVLGERDRQPDQQDTDTPGRVVTDATDTSSRTRT